MPTAPPPWSDPGPVLLAAGDAPRSSDGSPGPRPTPRRPGRVTALARQGLGILRRHPIVCLLLLSPGIPEYLSSSSPLAGLLVSPVAFLLFLALNVGLYGPGVLLIREASIRWTKGWGSVLVLGAGYAILEEGIALSTFFNSSATQVGALGYYGHWLGVSWVWAAGLVVFHAVFSIFLPIRLFHLALPEVRGRPLLAGARLPLVIAILAVDAGVLMAVVRVAAGFWLGLPLLAGSLAAIAILVGIGRALPTGLLAPMGTAPEASPWVLGGLGVLLFPAILISEGLLAAYGAPPVLAVGAIGLLIVLWLRTAVDLLGPLEGGHGEIALWTGCLLPILVFGLLASIRLPVVLLADAAVVALLRHLWRASSVRPGPVATDHGIVSPSG